MGTVLTTSRLLLRTLSMDDVDDAAQLYAHPDVWEFDPGHEPSRTEIETMLQYRIWQQERNGFGALAVESRENGAFLGQCGLQTYVWEQLPVSSVEMELFYKLGRPFWGHGYAAEACAAVLDFAFGQLKLPRIVSWTNRENARSTALMRRLGMDLRARADQPELIAGVLERAKYKRG